MGLPDKLSKRVAQHEFEALKSQNNEASADRTSAPPAGRRFDGKHEQDWAIAKKRAVFDDWKVRHMATESHLYQSATKTHTQGRWAGLTTSVSCVAAAA